MNLYLISQEMNSDYDTFDSAVVCAESDDEAREIHPDGRAEWSEHTWVKKRDIEFIAVKLIGTAAEGIQRGVVISSFNAG